MGGVGRACGVGGCRALAQGVDAWGGGSPGPGPGLMLGVGAGEQGAWPGPGAAGRAEYPPPAAGQGHPGAARPAGRQAGRQKAVGSHPLPHLALPAPLQRQVNHRPAEGAVAAAGRRRRRPRVSKAAARGSSASRPDTSPNQSARDPAQTPKPPSPTHPAHSQAVLDGGGGDGGGQHRVLKCKQQVH